MRFIIISGVSGGGKSVALHALEDLGYFSVDNLPLRLLPALADELTGHDRVAAVVDARDPRQTLEGFASLLDEIRLRGISPEVIFVEADRDVLIERFSETRRRHPLTEGERPLAEALERESKLLQPVRQRAEIIIDSTRTNIHQLRSLVQDRVGRHDPRDAMSLLLQSFGFKHGTPRDTDLMFDVRCLPNPYWNPALRGLTGKDDAVRTFLGASNDVLAMCRSLTEFLERWIPCFEQENRVYLSVSIGCTGGRHRSVYVVETLAERLRVHYPYLLVRHRDLNP